MSLYFNIIELRYLYTIDIVGYNHHRYHTHSCTNKSLTYKVHFIDELSCQSLEPSLHKIMYVSRLGNVFYMARASKLVYFF